MDDRMGGKAGEKICSIICGAPCGALPRELVEGFVIAADRGLDHSLNAGIVPDLAVGDFDSARAAVPEGVQCVKVPPEKDDTDAILAADLAVERGCRELRFFCALGGRVDHTVANIQMLYRYKRRGIGGALFGDGACVFLLSNESARIPKFDGYLSVFSYGEAAVVTETGVKYPVTEYPLSNDMPIGVSNEITGDFAEITVHSGTALVMKVNRD